MVENEEKAQTEVPADGPGKAPGGDDLGSSSQDEPGGGRSATFDPEAPAPDLPADDPGDTNEAADSKVSVVQPDGTPAPNIG